VKFDLCKVKTISSISRGNFTVIMREKNNMAVERRNPTAVLV